MNGKRYRGQEEGWWERRLVGERSGWKEREEEVHRRGIRRFTAEEVSQDGREVVNGDEVNMMGKKRCTGERGEVPRMRRESIQGIGMEVGTIREGTQDKGQMRWTG